MSDPAPDALDEAAPDRSPMLRGRLVGALAGLVLIAAVVALVARPDGPHRMTAPMGSAADPTDVRFATLAAAHTNRCGLRAGALAHIDPDNRLQGACCSPMDRKTYADQRRRLTAYREVDVVPRDPYDIPVALAQRLVGFRSIRLDAGQQDRYERAMSLADEHGPCCCHCWRWDAFEGQAKYLLTARGYTAQQVAALWDAEDGCGGRDAT